jgi:hypothetical protein
VSDRRRHADARARLAATAPAPVVYLTTLDRVMAALLHANRRRGLLAKASDVRVLAVRGEEFANVVGISINEETGVLEIVVDEFA